MSYILRSIFSSYHPLIDGFLLSPKPIMRILMLNTEIILPCVKCCRLGHWTFQSWAKSNKRLGKQLNRIRAHYLTSRRAWELVTKEVMVITTFIFNKLEREREKKKIK